MDIAFTDRKLQKICSSSRELTKHFGSDCGKLIGRRLQEMEAARSLDELRMLPQAKCHALTGDRQGQFAVSAKHPYRVVFRPTQLPLPTKSDGGLDWTSVTAVTIIEIVDYHGN